MDFLTLISQTSTPIMLTLLIAGGLVYIIIFLLKKFGMVKEVRDTQVEVRATQLEKYPEMEKFFEVMKTLEGQNLALLENHFKHEVPEIRADIKEIKETVNFIKDNHGNRLTAVEKDIQYIRK